MQDVENELRVPGMMSWVGVSSSPPPPPPSDMATPSPTHPPRHWRRSAGRRLEEKDQFASLVVTVHKATRLARVNTHVRRSRPFVVPSRRSLWLPPPTSVSSLFHRAPSLLLLFVFVSLFVSIKGLYSEHSVGPVCVTLLFERFVVVVVRR